MVSPDDPGPARVGCRDDIAVEALAEIRRILADEVELLQAVAPEDELAGDLRVDSVGALILAVGLEDHFRILLDDADAARVVTVEDLALLVARRVCEARAKEEPPAAPPEETR